jgi:hypothetical protein
MGQGLTCLLRGVGHMDLRWIWIAWEMDMVGVVAEVEIWDEGDLTVAVRPTVVIETGDIAGLEVTAGLAHVLTVVVGIATAGIADGTTMIGEETTTIGAGDLLAAIVAEVGAVLVSVMVQDLHSAERVTKLEICLTCHLVEGAAAGAVVQMTTVSWTGPLPKREKEKRRVEGAVEVGARIVVVVVANEARAVDVAKNLQSDNVVEADRDIN